MERRRLQAVVGIIIWVNVHARLTHTDHVVKSTTECNVLELVYAQRTYMDQGSVHGVMESVLAVEALLSQLNLLHNLLQYPPHNLPLSQSHTCHALATEAKDLVRHQLVKTLLTTVYGRHLAVDTSQEFVHAQLKHLLQPPSQSVLTSDVNQHVRQQPVRQTLL